jgi:hypothetical protein
MVIIEDTMTDCDESTDLDENISNLTFCKFNTNKLLEKNLGYQSYLSNRRRSLNTTTETWAEH